MSKVIEGYRGPYNPDETKPYKVSRSKIDLFMECPRCFYLDRRLGVPRPEGFPFNINKAIDTLLKKEFDAHRAAGSRHPLMETYGIEAVPFAHEDMDQWRENFVGVQYLHRPTSLLVFGAVDDVWKNADGELAVVDYKATSKRGEVSLDADWQITYKRQMEVYQWLLRRNDFAVSDTGYFVYCNGRDDAAAFDGKIEFDIKIIPYTGSDDWIEPTLRRLHATLNSDEVPPATADCDYCNFYTKREATLSSAQAA